MFFFSMDQVRPKCTAARHMDIGSAALHSRAEVNASGKATGRGAYLRDNASAKRLCSAGRCPTRNCHCPRIWRHATSRASATISRRPERLSASCNALVLSPRTDSELVVYASAHKTKASTSVKNSQKDWYLDVPGMTPRWPAEARVQRTNEVLGGHAVDT